MSLRSNPGGYDTWPALLVRGSGRYPAVELRRCSGHAPAPTARRGVAHRPGR